jgi:transglutaminase-like putative cysteine protease
MVVVRLPVAARAAVLAALSALLVSVVAHQTRRIFEPGFRGGTVVLVPVVALLIGLSSRHRDWRFRATLQAVGVVVMTGVAVRLEHGELPGDVVRAVFRGLTGILSSRWPVPVLPIEFAGIVFAVAVASAVSVELALSRKFGVAILTPPLVLLLLVALLAAEAGPPSAQVLAAFALLSLIVLRLAALIRSELPSHARGSPDDADRRSRLTMSIVGTTAVVVGLVPAVLNGVLASDNRFDPRDELNASSIVEIETSPLARLDEWRTRTPANQVFLTSTKQTGRWRLAALTRYDGRTWMPPDDFRTSGRRLREPLDDAAVERVDVTIADLNARWLPAPDRTLEVNIPVLVDGSHGNLLARDEPVIGTTYELAIEPSGITKSQLAGRRVAQQGEILVDGLELPASLRELASTITEGEQTDLGRAEALETYLRENYDLVNDSPAGHSLGVLTTFLERSKRGRDEQFVASYGLLAQAIGLPVRVAVGFDLEDDPDGGSVAFSDRVRVWPEIEFQSVGWVPFNPIPDAEAIEDVEGDDPAAAVDQGEDSPPPTTAAPAPATTTGGNSPIVLAPSNLVLSSVVVKLGLAIVAVLLVLATYVIVVLQVKSARRQRRRAAEDPEQRIAGAFRSGIDTLVDLGASAPVSKTDLELVSVGIERVGGPAEVLTPLAAISTKAVYDKPRPNEAASDEAWEQLEAFDETAKENYGWWRYARARLSLRSLRRGLPDDS